MHGLGPCIQELEKNPHKIKYLISIGDNFNHFMA